MQVSENFTMKKALNNDDLFLCKMLRNCLFYITADKKRFPKVRIIGYDFI